MYFSISVFVHVQGIGISSSPDACPMDHKNEKQTCHCPSASADKYCNFLRQFLPRQTACIIMIYERNYSLQVSTGPNKAFELCWVTRTESEHKNLLSCHVTCLMAALQDKTLSWWFTIFEFSKRCYSYLPQLQSMDYRERQWSQFVRVSGLRNWYRNLDFVNGHLEMVDKAYVNCVRAQSFINCVLNTIPQP